MLLLYWMIFLGPMSGRRCADPCLKIIRFLPYRRKGHPRGLLRLRAHRAPGPEQGEGGVNTRDKENIGALLSFSITLDLVALGFFILESLAIFYWKLTKVRSPKLS